MKELCDYRVTWYNMETETEESEAIQALDSFEAHQQLTEGIGSNYKNIICDIEVEFINVSKENDICRY